MGYYKNNRCRVCNSADIQKVISFAPSPLADSYITNTQLHTKQDLYPMDVYKCDVCGLVQLIDIIEPQDIYIDYLYRTNTSIGLPEHFIQGANEVIKRFHIPQKSLILDIGSNDGSLLQGYKNLGMRVLGIDPAKEVVKEAISKGIETLCIFFDLEEAKKLMKEYGKAKIITCNNLIANIDNLNNFMQGVKKMLDDDGVFIGETSYLLSLIDSMVFDTIYHEHLSYFGIKPLEHLCKVNGLMLFDAQVVETKGGSLRFFITHINTSKQKSTNLLRLHEIERERFLYHKKIYAKLEDNIEKIKIKLVRFINKVLEDGKSIIGYGASNTTTTLLYHFGLNDKIKYIVDDNVIKIGRFTPHNHIPIYSPDKIYEDNPDFIIIFAWRYTDMIIEKHHQYLENNGTFIVPLKEFSLIQGV